MRIERTTPPTSALISRPEGVRTPLIRVGNRTQASEERATRPGRRIRVITTEQELDALEPEWNDLLENAIDASPFLSFPWLREWWRAFGQGHDMYLVGVWQNASLVGVAPLAYRILSHWARPRRAIVFWSNAYSNRIHFVVRRDSAGVIDEIVDHLARQAPPWDLWLLEPVLAESRLTRELLSALAAHGLRHGVDIGLRSPFVSLPEAFEELLGRLSPGSRRSLRRKSRAFDAEPKTGLAVRRDAGALEHAFAVAADSWKHEAGTSIVSTQAVRGFYQGITREAALRGWLQIALLELEDEAISFEYNLEFEGVLYNLKLGYRSAFASRSPGLVLKQHVLRDAIERGLTEYDFLGAEEHYKTQWSSGLRSHLRITVFGPGTALRATYIYRYRVKPTVRRLLPGAVRLKNVVAPWLRGVGSPRWRGAWRGRSPGTIVEGRSMEARSGRRRSRGTGSAAKDEGSK